MVDNKYSTYLLGRCQISEIGRWDEEDMLIEDRKSSPQGDVKENDVDCILKDLYK